MKLESTIEKNNDPLLLEMGVKYHKINQTIEINECFITESHKARIFLHLSNIANAILVS